MLLGKLHLLFWAIFRTHHLPESQPILTETATQSSQSNVCTLHSCPIFLPLALYVLLCSPSVVVLIVLCGTAFVERRCPTRKLKRSSQNVFLLKVSTVARLHPYATLTSFIAPLPISNTAFKLALPCLHAPQARAFN